MKVLATLAATALATLAAAPATAQAGSYYSATAKGELKKSSLVTRSTVWKCADGTCTARKAPERDTVLCALVAQRVGELTAFTVAGAAFEPDALAKCNASAR